MKKYYILLDYVEIRFNQCKKENKNYKNQKQIKIIKIKKQIKIKKTLSVYIR
tara:strand:- start:835 stop:990 length:156 start_codon:yes stop_codon:yes gene_type:complete